MANGESRIANRKPEDREIKIMSMTKIKNTGGRDVETENR